MLAPELLCMAYRQGIFPMAVDTAGTIGWFAPDPRGIIPLDDRFHVPHGLRRTLKKNRYAVTFDQDFEGVIRACATLRKDGNWISEEIIQSYTQLYRQGYAHSVEVWSACHLERSEGSLGGKPEIPRSARNDIPRRLVGGLYGVHLGGAFFGESMFHRETDASKVALVALVERLRAGKFALLDTQWLTPHLAQFGTYEITRGQYLRRLRAALALDCRF
jgi:leucyl/phenylalanyl-tRNA--protein transferase